MAWYNSALDYASGAAFGLGGYAVSRSTHDEKFKNMLFGSGTAALKDQAGQAGTFANDSQKRFEGLNTDADAAQAGLARQASGQQSVAAEQGRQALQQLYAQQQSAAAGASPGNAAMAARTAAIQAGRAGVGIAGQTQVAALQEQQAAQRAWAEMILRRREQELQATTQSRSTAVNAFSNQAQDGGLVGKYGPQIAQIAAVASDRRLKKKIRKKDLSKGLDAIEGYEYEYRDKRLGAGKKKGIMAQDLERAGFGHAVIDTPIGKVVDGGQLATTLAGVAAGLHRRLAKLEGKR